MDRAPAMRLALDPTSMPFLASHPSISSERASPSTSPNRGERLSRAASRNVRFTAHMAATYEARGTIVATNIEFGKWGTVLGDARLATATVDGIMPHGRLIGFGGQSRRFEEALMMGRSEG